MNLAFGVLSSREPPASVGQLLDAIGTGVRTWVHHDPGKGLAPVSVRRDVVYVPHPVATAWGNWSLCEAILALLREALRDPGWDYFQLLSGSCLPVRPLDAFAAHIAASDVDLHMDAVALERDEVARMSHGFKAYAATGSLRHRVLRRARRWYLGAPHGEEQRAGLAFAVPAPGGAERPVARLIRAGMRRIGHGSMPALDHPFRPGLDCWVGSTWWGARRAVCEAFVAAPDDALRRHARGMLNCDEFYFHTLACNGGWRIGPSNHWIAPFEGPHPARVATRDLPAIRASGRWFARKFAPDPADLARLAVLGARAGRHAPRRVSALRLA